MTPSTKVGGFIGWTEDTRCGVALNEMKTLHYYRDCRKTLKLSFRTLQLVELKALKIRRNANLDFFDSLKRILQNTVSQHS